jgi:hypothetical protein
VNRLHGVTITNTKKVCMGGKYGKLSFKRNMILKDPIVKNNSENWND